MKNIKRLFLTFSFIALAINSFATWSIIVIDPKTKEIGIAGASCTYSVYGIGAIMPGKGAIVVQAMSNKAARNRGLNMIAANASPEQILAALKDPKFMPELQQYAIVCMNDLDKPATYTGSENYQHKGSFTARGVSIQGNTLTHENELQAVMDAVLKAQKESMSIQDVLMIALEAGAKAGGDNRCGARKASSAFITVARPGDDEDSPYLNLVVTDDDKSNAVEALRKKFDKWKTVQRN